MKIRRRSTSPLHKKAKRGFRGYPVATIAFYGPTGSMATKVAAGVVNAQGEEPAELQGWLLHETDVRHDPEITGAILDFITQHSVRSVAMTNDLLGCSHEEGIDYPAGESCPQCPDWAGRDRFTKERAH